MSVFIAKYIELSLLSCIPVVYYIRSGHRPLKWLPFFPELPKYGNPGDFFAFFQSSLRQDSEEW